MDKQEEGKFNVQLVAYPAVRGFKTEDGKQVYNRSGFLRSKITTW